MTFIAEPMIDVSQIPDWYWRSIGVFKFFVNDKGSALPNLWALWRNSSSPIVIFVSSQCIILELSLNNANVYVAAVYASTSYLTRRELWANLTLVIGRHPGPWLFLGDFNNSWCP